MDFKQVIGVVENSKEFKDFIKKNPHYYLVHVFSTVDSENFDSVWQIGYYSKDTDKIVVFEDHDDMVFIHPEAEAFKKEEYILKLDIENLKVSREDAMNLCKNVLKDYYFSELFSKAIVLLQNLPEFGQVWNISLVTLTFSVINVKIDASTGQVLVHRKENLMNWK